MTEPLLPPARTRRRRWRPSLILIVTVVAATIGATLLMYSPAASWLTAYNQAEVLKRTPAELKTVDPGPAEQLREAHLYNSALSSGALLAADENVPTGNGKSSDKTFTYADLLRTPNGVMARIQIPAINLDLPIYHGTSDAALLKGAGHLEGTSLPVGGTSTHAVIAAHRGMADAVMFTNLDQVKVGDEFTISVFGQVLTYRVFDTRVVDPEDTASLRQEAGRDLVTLVTCTPLGINTERILVTGERILPTPQAAKEAALAPPADAGFPWWAVIYLVLLGLIGVFTWWAGLERHPARQRRRARRESPGTESEPQTLRGILDLD